MIKKSIYMIFMAALFTLIEYFAPMQWSPCQRPTPNRPTQFPNCNAYIAFRNPSVNSDKAGEREIYIIYKKGFSREEFWSQLSQSNRFVAVNSHSHSLNIVSTSTHQLYIFTHTRTGICEKEGEKYFTEMTHIYMYICMQISIAMPRHALLRAWTSILLRFLLPNQDRILSTLIRKISKIGVYLRFP